MGRASNRKQQSRADGMRLRIQATVREVVEGGLAKLVMDDVRPEHQPLVVLARHCPADVAVGQSAVLTGALRMCGNHGTRMIVPLLTVEEVSPPSALSPWAHLEAVARITRAAMTMIGPLQDADATVLLANYTAAAAELPATGAAVHVPLQMLRCVARPVDAERSARDAVADLLTVLRPGERVRVRGDLYLLGRMPDDTPGADLQLELADLARAS
jgi:hypothetical protein